MNSDVYGKTMEKLRNIISTKLQSNEKYYLKWKSKPSYVFKKIFDNLFVLIRKNNFKLKLNKRAYVEMCILDLSKVLMYEFYYDCIKNICDIMSRIIIN